MGLQCVGVGVNRALQWRGTASSAGLPAPKSAGVLYITVGPC